jgi:hypothetical protein
VHDFMDRDLGKAIPYGAYDVATDAGWVTVGADHDTAEFAVATIATWWRKAGSPAHPDASRLLITADGGGSNGYRTRVWKIELARLAAETWADHHPVPPAAGHQQVEQDRAPAVLPHFDELARKTPDQPRSCGQHHYRDNHPHRAHRGRRTRHREQPRTYQDQDRQMHDLEHTSLRRHAFHGDWNPEISVLLIDRP